MADTLDILTLPEAKTALNIDALNVDHDDEIAQHVTAISRIIDDECGPVVQRTITAELHDGGGASIVLRHAPVASVTTLREAAGSTITTLTAVGFGETGDGYSLKDGVLSRRFGGSVSSWTSGNALEVTYVAGRYASTAAVDAKFKAAAAAILRRLWKREAGAWAQSPEWFEQLGGGNDTPIGSGFFRVAKPIIDEMLPRERQRVGFV